MNMKSHVKPSKELLAALLVQFPLVEIGRQFGVSYEAVRQWRNKYGLSERYRRKRTIEPCVYCGNTFRDAGQEHRKYCSDECWKAKQIETKHRERLKRKQRQSGSVPSSVDHGKESTYINYACRCGDCKTAHAQYYRQYMRRRLGIETE